MNRYHAPSLLAVLTCALLASSQTVPRFDSLAGDAFTTAESVRVVDWILGRPEVETRLGDHRTRVLRVGSDQPKGADGVYRRATLFVRDYDSGIVHWLSANLETGELDLRVIDGAVQPSREEIAEAEAIILADAEFAERALRPDLVLHGGFHNRSPYLDDPCHRDVCLEMAFMPKAGGGGPDRVVMVNLSRGEIAHRDFPGTLDPAQIPRMTVIEAKEEDR